MWGDRQVGMWANRRRAELDSVGRGAKVVTDCFPNCLPAHLPTCRSSHLPTCLKDGICDAHRRQNCRDLMHADDVGAGENCGHYGGGIAR